MVFIVLKHSMTFACPDKCKHIAWTLHFFLSTSTCAFLGQNHKIKVFFAQYARFAVSCIVPVRFYGFYRNFMRFCGFWDPSDTPPIFK